MTAFSNIPSHAVLPLSTYRLDDLRKAAEHADQRFLEVNLGASHSRREILNRLAKGLAFPPHFGNNLDALYDCVTDLAPNEEASHPGIVIVLEDIPESEGFDAGQRDALLDVFRNAAEFFFDRKTAFRVFYSVARPQRSAGPPAGAARH